MLINILDFQKASDETVSTITVTDGNNIRNVTPYMIFDALLYGRMESQTARLALYGIDILVNNQVTQIQVSMDASTKRLVKNKLGVVAENIVKNKPQKSEIDPVQEKLAAERQAYLTKQQQWFDENKRKADEARAKGLINLSNDERRKLRQEHYTNVRNQYK